VPGVPAWGLIDVAYLTGFIAATLTGAAELLVTDALTERFGAFIIIVLG